jgi:hypothetical protein
MRHLIYAGVFVLAGCSTPDAFPDDPKVRAGEEFTLAAGASASLDNRFLVTFEKVLEDSRCPMNARCVWEGNARVLISVIELRPGKIDEYHSWPLELNTSERFATRQSAGALTLQIRLLDPTPMAGQSVEKYSVTLIAELRP